MPYKRAAFRFTNNLWRMFVKRSAVSSNVRKTKWPSAGQATLLVAQILIELVQIHASVYDIRMTKTLFLRISRTHA